MSYVVVGLLLAVLLLAVRRRARRRRVAESGTPAEQLATFGAAAAPASGCAVFARDPLTGRRDARDRR